MIRKLLATTAIATLVATGAAVAQTTTPAPSAAPMDAAPAPQVKHAEGHLASNLIGETVYNGSGEDAENIGEVSDLVLDAEGNVEAIVVGVGGFLGIGQKKVALEYDLVEWAEMDGDEYIVVETTREALEAQPEFDVAAYEPQPADAEIGNTKPATEEDLAAAPVEGEDAAGGDAATDDMAAAPTEEPAGEATGGDDMAAAPADDAAEGGDAATDDMAAAPADDAAEGGDAATDDMAAAPADDAAEGGDAATDDMAAAPTDDPAAGTDETQTSAIDRSTLNEANMADIRAEDFVGTTVYGANDENIGEIGDVILSEDGKVDAVLVDVGGFLGMGEKEVAVGMENLAFLADEEGNYYLYTQFTQEQLEAQPAYDEATFADARDEQLLVNPAQ